MTRIVKMKFKAEHLDAFREIFRQSKPKIEAFPGCTRVDLMEVLNEPNVLMTHSSWDGPESLEAYRKSELFRTTWAKTKVLFDDRPQAWSLEKLD